MARRYLGSLLIGVLVGLAAGVFTGWELYPVEYTNSSLSNLSPNYKEEYTVMVAEGYLYDGDINAALARLQPLGYENLFDYIQDLTERFISQSNVPAIGPMVALSEAIGRPVEPGQVLRATPAPTPSSVGEP